MFSVVCFMVFCLYCLCSLTTLIGGQTFPSINARLKKPCGSFKCLQCNWIKNITNDGMLTCFIVPLLLHLTHENSPTHSGHKYTIERKIAELSVWKGSKHLLGCFVHTRPERNWFQTYFCETIFFFIWANNHGFFFYFKVCKIFGGNFWVTLYPNYPTRTHLYMNV